MPTLVYAFSYRLVKRRHGNFNEEAWRSPGGSEEDGEAKEGADGAKKRYLHALGDDSIKSLAGVNLKQLKALLLEVARELRDEAAVGAGAGGQ